MNNPTTRERLIRVTADELARGGYRSLSLRAVAARAGIGPATVFHHFPDGKQALYEATVQHVVDEITTLASMSHDEAGDTGAVELIVGRAARFWDFLQAKPELAAMVLHESLAHEGRDGNLLQQHAGAVVELAVGFIVDSQRRGELGAFEPRRFLLWATLHILSYHGAPRIQQHLFGENAERGDDRDAYLTMLREYLRGNMPGSY